MASASGENCIRTLLVEFEASGLDVAAFGQAEE